jgi:23S rRNA-/tRNA-specific pseudouridylate synthase
LSLLVTKLKLTKQRALVMHRIDRFATGALLFAKTGTDRDALVRQLLDHTPVRQCLAMLSLRIRLPSNGCIESELLRSKLTETVALVRFRYSSNVTREFLVDSFVATA